MFSKNRPDEQIPQPSAPKAARAPEAEAPRDAPAQSAPKAKPAPSVMSSDITVVGNLRSSGDIQIEGTVEGDIRAQVLIVGEGATVKGEVVAEDVVVNGRVIARPSSHLKCQSPNLPEP